MAPPGVVAVSAVSGSLWIAVVTVVVWLPLEIVVGPLGIAVAIVAVWLPLVIAVLPEIVVGQIETVVGASLG